MKASQNDQFQSTILQKIKEISVNQKQMENEQIKL